LTRFLQRLETSYFVAVIIIGLAWIIDVPRYVGDLVRAADGVGLDWLANLIRFADLSLVEAEWIGPLLGIGIAAALIRHPYSSRFKPIDAALGFLAIACWTWMSMNYNDWIIDIAGYTAAKYVPGIIAILLLMEGLRKAGGLPITILVWILIGYGFFGYLLPQPFQAEQLSAPSLVMYLYADTNGVPGLVMAVVGKLVLAFIVLGRLMEATGAIKFFTDLALAAMGSRRGGPAKVAVVASSIFGSINGTAVGNIMSTGIVTIPLMKESGFKAKFAAAIEAVASNGGQIAPPVMGATAFLIAEFLQVGYFEVVSAALVPALLYYVCLFVQVDAISARLGLRGIAKERLPKAKPLLRTGWIFLVPLAVLIDLLFGLGFDPALSALAAAVTLFVLSTRLAYGFPLIAFIYFFQFRGFDIWVALMCAALTIPILSTIKDRRFLRFDDFKKMVVGGGESMLPLIMIAGGAGIVIGVMNITGLGFSLSLVLSQIGETSGLFVMLVLTAMISIVLGMGMPTTAIYVVLSVVLAPALVNMGITPMGAHLFIFYFGLLSFLTPPVAIASYVAAGLAGSGMWETSWEGVKLATMAYILPFIWCYNPALIMDGTPLEIVYAVGTALLAAFLVAHGIQGTHFDTKSGKGATQSVLVAAGIVLGAIAVGGSTIWFGASSSINLLVAAGGIAGLFVIKMLAARRLEA
jgi:TRAP transporter 4TM/12TM fusion protein